MSGVGAAAAGAGIGMEAAGGVEGATEVRGDSRLAAGSSGFGSSDDSSSAGAFAREGTWIPDCAVGAGGVAAFRAGGNCGDGTAGATNGVSTTSLWSVLVIGETPEAGEVESFDQSVGIQTGTE